MTCDCGAGTTWYDHDAERWKTNDHKCRSPTPRTPRNAQKDDERA